MCTFNRLMYNSKLRLQLGILWTCTGQAYDGWKRQSHGLLVVHTYSTLIMSMELRTKLFSHLGRDLMSHVPNTGKERCVAWRNALVSPCTIRDVDVVSTMINVLVQEERLTQAMPGSTSSSFIKTITTIKLIYHTNTVKTILYRHIRS